MKADGKATVLEGGVPASSSSTKVSSASHAEEVDKESSSVAKDENAMDIEGGVEKKAVAGEPSSEVLSNPGIVLTLVFLFFDLTIPSYSYCLFGLLLCL